MLVGSLAYFGLHVVWVTLALPATYLILGAGFVYAHIFSFWEGVVISALISIAATCTGSILAFLNGRYILKNCVQRSFEGNRKWGVINHLAERHGIKLILLLRFTFVPSSMVNYGTSVTKLAFLHYVIGLIALIPDVFIHSLVGAEFSQFKDMLSGHITKSEMPLFIAGIVVMIISIILVIGLVYYAKKQFDRLIAQQEAEDRAAEQTQQEQQEDGTSGQVTTSTTALTTSHKTEEDTRTETVGEINGSVSVSQNAFGHQSHQVPKKVKRSLANKFWSFFGYRTSKDVYEGDDYQSIGNGNGNGIGVGGVGGIGGNGTSVSMQNVTDVDGERNLDLEALNDMIDMIGETRPLLSPKPKSQF